MIILTIVGVYTWFQVGRVHKDNNLNVAMALESLVIFNITTTTKSCKEIFETLFLGLQGAKQK